MSAAPLRDLEGFLAALSGIPHVTDPAYVRRKSRDMTLAFSPTMKREFSDRTADAIVQPQSKGDILRIASAAARYRVPLVARGGGTCNFGQGIPLAGGAIVDMTALNRIVAVVGATVRAETGARLIDIDAATKPSGFELRMHPSTRRAATLGGYVGGGHAGVGSCAYGILRDRGNILGLELVSVEVEPRRIELRGPDVNLVHHAYGANGLMTEIEMPLAPAWPWIEWVVVFPEFMNAVGFAHAAASSDGIVKKLLSITGWPLPRMIEPLASLIPEGSAMALCMFADISQDASESLVREFGGEIVSRAPEGKGAYGAPIYEFAWGHARLHINKVDPRLNSAVGLFPPEDLISSIERVYRRFREIGPLHLEVKRFDGALSFQGSPLFRHDSDGDLARIIAGMEAEGVRVANNHTFLVRQGGMKSVAEADVAFKRAMDPHGLLNPGKLDLDGSETQVESAGATIATSGWSYRDGARGAQKGPM